MCLTLTALVFADVAGDGSLDCPGCDGVLTAEDRELAAAAGLDLPAGMQLVVYDLSEPGGSVLWEETLTPDGPAVTHEVNGVCGVLPLRVQLKLPAGAWAACPVVGALEREVTTPGDATVTFPLTAGCPLPTPTLSPTLVPPTATAPPPTAAPGEQPATPTAVATEALVAGEGTSP